MSNKWEGCDEEPPNNLPIIIFVFGDPHTTQGTGLRRGVFRKIFPYAV